MFQLDLPGKLPGQELTLPTGQRCDNHPDRPAVKRVVEHATAIDCEGKDLCLDCIGNFDFGQSHGSCDMCGMHRSLTAVHDPADDSGDVYHWCNQCIQAAKANTGRDPRTV